MNNNTKQILEALIPQTETRNSINEILNLDDKKFKAIEPELTKTIKETLNDPTIDKHEIHTELSKENVTKQQMQETIDSARNVVSDDNTLSKEKKHFLIELFTSSLQLIEVVAENPRQKIKVQIKKLSPDAVLPTYAHDSDAGADIYTIKDEHIPAHKTQIIDTGFAVAVPKGYEIQIRARSGMSLKTKIRIANAVGTIK